MPERKRVVVTGMSVNTPLGDSLDGFLESLLQGRSALGQWRTPDSTRIVGEMFDYDVTAKASLLAERVPGDVGRRLRRLIRSGSWSTNLSMLLAVDAFLEAGLFSTAVDAERIAAIIGGHNLNELYLHRNWEKYAGEPLDSDPLLAVKEFDSDHAGCVAEVLGIAGPLYTAGGACASGNVCLRCALDEVRHHGVNVALVVGAVFDFTAPTLYSLARMWAISSSGFNDEPARASRPFDVAREGFILSHGGAVLVVEELEHALARGAHIHGEILGVEVNSASTRTPLPSEEHQARVIAGALRCAGIEPQEIDFISAHATSTVAGDLAEIRAIKQVFGDHAKRLKINAPKSMLGHTAWSSAVVETVAALLQMRAGRLHPSINIDSLDPEIDLDVCADGAVQVPVRCFLKNAFGFGGINSAAVFRRFEGCPPEWNGRREPGQTAIR
jgi:3-oxoacyl-(acyl-carrier-protein) synthase